MFKPSLTQHLFSKNGLLFAPLLTITVFLVSCSGDDDRPDEEGLPPSQRTYAVFSPATSDLPVPNDILFSSEEAGDGTMYVDPVPGNPVTAGIDALDGSSVLAPIDISFSGSLQTSQDVDAASFITAGGAVIPNPSQNVFLLPLSYPGGDALVQASINGSSVEVPTFAKAATYARAAASGDVATLLNLATPDARAEIISLDGGNNNVLRIYPLQPLMPETKYLVVVTGLLDEAGNEVLPAIAYDYLADPASNLTPVGLDSLREAINGWQQLAAGYFGFMQTVFDQAGGGAAPSAEDVIFSMTFTTAGTTSSLKSIAAPETFFEKSLTRDYRHDAIAKLVGGTYNLSADNSNLTDAVDSAINSTLNFLLTSEMLPGDTPNPLFNPDIATAIAAGADFATLSADASAAYLLQVAAGEAALNVHNSDGVTIQMEAIGTVQAMADGAGAPVDYIFPVPAPRTTNFYRVDLASDLNEALIAPALVYRGDITLPYFLEIPDGSDGTLLTQGFWDADPTIGSIIDAGQGNEAGTTPPSDMVTYRYPFPQRKSTQVFPIQVVTPEPTTLSNFGITKPDDGWPVIIFVHGITTDRSVSLTLGDALAFACIEPDLSGPSGADCYATVSIDQPLHGFTPAGSRIPGQMSVSDPDFVAAPNIADHVPTPGLTERHFNFTANAALQPVPMDYSNSIGESGSLFINLSNFMNVRDNLRQMAIDLLNVSASLDSMDVNGDGVADDLDPNNVYVIAHSLGGITSLPFLALNNLDEIQNSPYSTLPKVKAAAVMSAGSAPPTLLINSQTFSESILAGLAAASPELQIGRSGLETYLAVFQGILDAVDPIHFAPYLSEANSDTGVLMTEIIGNGGSAPSDLVIPNGADPQWGLSPLNGFNAVFAGTEPLLHAIGAEETAGATSDGDPAVIVTRFTEGAHTTPIVAGNTDIDPYTTQASFNELLSQIVTFFTLEGDVPGSIISNPDVVEP